MKKIESERIESYKRYIKDCKYLYGEWSKAVLDAKRELRRLRENEKRKDTHI